MKDNEILKKVKIKFDKEIPPSLVQKLYLSVGWQFREELIIKDAFQKSIAVTSAWLQDELIGVARATGDGVMNATIWDVAIKRDMQNKGIGNLMVSSMVEKLDACGIPLITLYTEYTKTYFYSKLGFESDLNRVVGMYRKCGTQAKSKCSWDEQDF